MSLTYAENKRTLFLDYDIERIKDFVKSLPATHLPIVISKLPKVNGFRPGKEIDIKLNNYCKRISRWSEKDWNLMYDIWLLWTQSSLIFQHAIKFNVKQELENELLSLQDDVKLKDLIIKLIQLCNTESVSQDTLKNWLDFSPFLPNADIEILLDLAPSHAEISMKTKLNSYEQRLKYSEIELQKITIQLKAILDNNSKQIIKSNQELSELKKSHSEIDFKVNESTQAYQQFSRHIEQLKRNTDTKIKENNGLLNQIKNVTNRLEQTITEIEDNLKDITIKSNSFDTQIHKLSEILATQKTEQELVSMKQELENTTSSFSHVSATTNYFSDTTNDLRIVSLSQNDNLATVALNKFEDVLVHLEKNLNGLGIKLSHARHLSVDVLSAISVGQLVTLSGSIALAVAETIANSLVSNSILSVKIPLGLMNSSSFDIFIEGLEQDSIGSTKAIIIEGLNRSAFEVYGAALQKYITNRILRINTNIQLFFFATITEGPSVLLPGKEIVELGPVFNTDALGWMDKFATRAVPGQIDLGVFDNVVSLLSSNYPDREDLGLPEWIFTGGGVLWRKSIITAEFASNYLWKSKNIEHDYLNTAFGWLVPMVLLIQNVQLSEFITIVELDDRSKALINLNIKDEGKDE